MNSARLAFKHLLREWRSGELYILFFALVIAVAAVSSVSFFTDRVENALATQANELLGADLLLNSEREISDEILVKASELQLQQVKQLTFPTMLMSENGGQLVWLKAAQSEFPLRGKLGISTKIFAPETTVEHMVSPDKVWVAPRLLTSLGLKVGDTVSLGEKSFNIEAILTNEPGAGGGLFNIAPRALILYEDVPETQLLQEGSRVRHTLMVSGDNAKIKLFRDYVEGLALVGVSVQGVRDARPEIRVALSRAEQFLGLAALTSVILAGVAIALAARRFSQRHLDHCAIMRCVGATQLLITQLYAWQILYLGLFASFVGCVVGYFSHELLINLLGSFTGIVLPEASFQPFLFGMGVGLVTLAGFALPPILSLRNVPALRVLKRDLGDFSVSRTLSHLVGIVALSIVMVWQANDLKLGLYMVGGALATVAVLAGCAFFVLLLLRSMKRKFVNAWWYGLRNLVRRPTASVVQIVAFGLGLMALLVLTLIRGDLLDEWQASIPADAPNRFLVNIHPEQVGSMQAFFEAQSQEVPTFYPMIRGRLVEINGEMINADLIEDPRGKALLSRELNLSWAHKMDEDNELIHGQWWSSDDPRVDLISIEKSVMNNLDIQLGDRVKFKVADQFFEAIVSSVREVDWGSFGANFYVIAKPGLLDNMPTTYMSPFYLPPENYEFLNTLLAEFPNLTVIDVAAIMTHVREIIVRVTLAVEYVFLFTLLSGVMVLFAGIQATHDERMLENGVIRTLGGSRKQILQSLCVEFVSLGLLAGLVAAILASVVAFVIAEYVLKIPAQVSWEIWGYGLLGGALCIGIVGVVGSLGVVRQPPLQILKKISG